MQTLKAPPAGIFEMEQEGSVLVLTPMEDLWEASYLQVEQGTADVLAFVDRGSTKNIIFDFKRTDSFGSTALGFFVQLWKKLKTRQGNLAFCHVSPHEKETLRITRLDKLWPICSSREEAFQTLGR